MKLVDLLVIIHPALAVIIVFPLVGIVSYFAWQTRQRRLQSQEAGKSKIPPTVGREHVKIGRWLSTSVILVTLVGLARPIWDNLISKKILETNSFQGFFVTAMFILTIASLVFLLRARQKLWRGIFATLTGLGVSILGWQEGVFRRDNEWAVSHFYYGILVCYLMIFSLAIIDDIYQDRSNRWRYVHIFLNCLALLLFIGQGITGTRDILEIGTFKFGPLYR